MLLKPMGCTVWVLAGGMFVMAGCSQNYSDKKVEEAFQEKGLQPLASRAAPSSSSSSGEVVAQRQSLGGISVTVPPDWRRVTPSSSMRLAEYLLPGDKAGAADASLAVFAGNWGSVEANLERWYGQFRQTDGQSTSQQARRWEKKVGGIPVTLVEITGIFTGGMGMEEGKGEPLSGYRMLGAIVDSPAGFFYFKLLGPAATVALWNESFDHLVDSVQPE